MDYSTVDIIILVPILFALIKGFKKGFILEIATLAGLIVGIYAAIKFSDLINDWLIESFQIDQKLLAFGITFAAVLIGLHFLAKLVEKLVKLVAMGWLNKIGGSIFALVKWTAILSVLIIIFDKINTSYTMVEKDELDSSLLYHPIKNFTPSILPFLEDFSEYSIPIDHLDSIPNLNPNLPEFQ